MSKLVGGLIGAVSSAAFGGPAAVSAGIPALSAIGFTSSGVAAGSIAAGVQSSIGSVAAGSLFASLQSAGATAALGTAGVAGLATVGVVGGAVVGGAAGAYAVFMLF